MSNEAKPVVTPVVADVPAYNTRGDRNGIAFDLGKRETERAKKGEDTVTYWGFDIGQYLNASVPGERPLPQLAANATDAQKKAHAEIIAANIQSRREYAIAQLDTLLGSDSDGKCILLDMVESKMNGSLLAAQKDKGKDNYDMTTKLQRAFAWFNNLSVARAVQKSPMDIAKDEMVTAIQDSAKALAAGTIDAAANALAVQSAIASYQKRVAELSAAMTAQALADAGITL